MQSPSGDNAVLTATIVAGPQHGQLVLNADPSTERPVFTYTPDADCNGADSFTYRVSDGELDSNIATVRLNDEVEIFRIQPAYC